MSFHDNLSRFGVILLLAVAACGASPEDSEEGDSAMVKDRSAIVFVQLEPDLQQRVVNPNGTVSVVDAQVQKFRDMAKGHYASSLDLVLATQLPQGKKFRDQLDEAMGTVEARLGPDTPIVLALGGHSNGKKFWQTGGAAAELSIDDLAYVAARHPVFSGHVRQLFLLGCNAGRQYWNDQWRAPFKTVVATAGFNNSGPSATNGGNAFVGGAWNLMPGSRPKSAKVKGQLDSLVFMGFSAGAFEIIDDGGTAHYASNVPPTLSNDAYDRISALQPKYACYLAAAKGCEDPPPDSTGNAVHDYYLAVQDYVTGLGQEGAPRDSFRYWELTLLPESLHLRRFQHDKGCFLLHPANRQRYAGVVGAKYDWLAAETTTRRQALDFLATLPSYDANVQLLVRALRDLDPRVMPDTCTD